MHRKPAHELEFNGRPNGNHRLSGVSRARFRAVAGQRQRPAAFMVGIPIDWPR